MSVYLGTMENLPENVRPRLRLLSREQMDAIHRYSAAILETTGIRVESKRALGIFEASGAVRVKDDVVCIQSDLVDHAIETAPSDIAIYDKNGELAFHLGEQQGDQTFFGIGVTNTYFQEIEGGRIEPFTRKHMQHSVKLGDLLGSYDMVSTLGIVSDVPADELDLYGTLDMYANTSKPLVLLILESRNINGVFDMLSLLHGDIAAKPFCIPYVNPVTPLVLNESTTDKVIAALKAQLPIMYSNYSLYGATSPVTEGGSLALLNAELLAGLVFGQLVKEGSGMILGSLPAAFNMRTAGSHYTPTSYLLNLACAEMMSFYGLPHCGTSGCGNGWGADLSASGDLWLNHLSSCIGKIGCAPFVGGNFDSQVFSPSTAVLSHHIIGEARKFARGFTLSDETVDTAGIAAVGHGGHYLTSEQTLASLSRLREADPIWPSLSLESWEERGKPRVETFLVDRTKDIYARAIRASAENADLIVKGERFIAAGG
ncbi:trimethylamine methyltransferase family protein [Candidatus Bipolaricaulota bacterium]